MLELKGGGGKLLIELDKKMYINMKGKFPEVSNHPVINSIIDGNNRGCIYVDSLFDTKTALFWAKQEMCFLVGNHINFALNDSLNEWVQEVLKPEAQKINETFFQVQGVPEEKWKAIIEEKFQHQYIKKYNRYIFNFNMGRYNQFKILERKTLEGFKIRRIDKMLLEIDQDNILQDEIGKFWESYDQFIKKGVGFCIMNGNKVISTCISAFVSGRNFEVSINTYNPKYRKKGLATLLGKAFIDYCVQNKITPHWGTETFRCDSIRVAEKCGFDKLNQYSFYCFAYDEKYNLIFSVCYYLKISVNISLAEELFGKVIDLEGISSIDYIELASSWAGVNQKHKAIFCLNKALEKNFDHLNQLLYDGNFNSLHDTEEWVSIIEELRERIN